jgi:AraC-like DNA-binding protein
VASVPGSPEAGGARAWRCADLGGLELFRATISEFSFRPHGHEEFFIALTESGTAAPAYRGGRHLIGPGDMIVLNPEEAHAGGPPPGASWGYRALYPSWQLMRQVAEEFAPGGTATPRFVPAVVRDPRAAALLLRFHQLSQSPGRDALHREACLVAGLTLLAGRHAARSRPPRPPGSEPRGVRLAADFLRAHSGEEVTLRDLVRLTGLTPYHLCRVFRQATGLTPHAFQIQARVRHARALLLAGCPIAQAATEAGFCDQAHLTRHFKAITGLSPARYLACLD